LYLASTHVGGFSPERTLLVSGLSAAPQLQIAIPKT